MKLKKFLLESRHIVYHFETDDLHRNDIWLVYQISKFSDFQWYFIVFATFRSASIFFEKQIIYSSYKLQSSKCDITLRIHSESLHVLLARGMMVYR